MSQVGVQSIPFPSLHAAGSAFQLVSGNSFTFESETNYRPTALAQQTMPSTPTTMKSRPKLKESCDHCAKAKVKCNREQPTCARCQDRDLKCGYSFSRRAGRRPGRVDRADSLSSPTSPELTRVSVSTAAAAPAWPSASMPPAPSLTPDLSTTSEGSMDAYASALASPQYMAPYHPMSSAASTSSERFGGFLDEYGSIPSTPVSSPFGMGTLSLDQSPIATLAYPSAGGMYGVHNPAYASGLVSAPTNTDSKSFRADLAGFQMHPSLTPINTAIPPHQHRHSVSHISPPGSAAGSISPPFLEAWQQQQQQQRNHKDALRLRGITGPAITCRYASSGENCLSKLNKILGFQAVKTAGQDAGIADLLAANRSILAIAVTTLSCACATRLPSLLNLLVYAAGDILHRYETGAAAAAAAHDGAASRSLFADVPYLERYLSVLQETLVKANSHSSGSDGGAWSKATLDMGGGAAPPPAPLPSPLVEINARTLALKTVLQRHVAAAST